MAGRRCIFSIVGRQMEWTDAVRRPPSHVAYGNCLFFMVWAADTAATMVRPRLIVISLSLECFFFRDYYKTNLFFYSLQARPPRSAACRVCFFFVVLSDPVGFVLASVLFWALSRSAFTWCNRLIPSPQSMYLKVICIETAFQVYLDNKSSCELVNHHPSPSDDAALFCQPQPFRRISLIIMLGIYTGPGEHHTVLFYSLFGS